MARKSYFLFLFFVQIVNLSAQPNMGERRVDSIPTPREQKQETVVINDYAFLIKEDSLYNIIVDFVWRIKNAYYIGGHTNIADTTIYVKILEPETKNISMVPKIRIGDVYEMRLFRYYPYRLSHSTDYYHNYNLLFGKKIVCLQATDCLNIIFTTNNLHGLHYFRENSFPNNFSSNLQQYIQRKDMASIMFWSIIQKNNQFINRHINSSAVKACQKRKSCPYSIVDHQNIHCLPPFVVKNNHRWINNATKAFDFSDMLFNMITSPYLNMNNTTELETSITINNIDIVYFNDKYVTYRILWVSSLFLPINCCTYLSFKKHKGNMKLIGISAFQTAGYLSHYNYQPLFSFLSV